MNVRGAREGKRRGRAVRVHGAERALEHAEVDRNRPFNLAPDDLAPVQPECGCMSDESGRAEVRPSGGGGGLTRLRAS